MSPNIQRLMMKLQRYDFDLMYTPGKHMVLADALSRAGVCNLCDMECQFEIFFSSSVPLSTITQS